MSFRLELIELIHRMNEDNLAQLNEKLAKTNGKNILKLLYWYFCYY